VRLQTFGKFGFDQVQLDIYFLRISLGNLVKDAQKILDPRFDDIILNAGERCIDPNFFEDKVIFHLISIAYCFYPKETAELVHV
jgi:hypothetical protein